MRACLCVIIALTSTSCLARVELKPNTPASPSAAEYRERCEAFESLDFGTVYAGALRGHTWIDDTSEREPVRGVQIAALDRSTDELRYVVSRANGAFEIAALAPGEYDVWTCLDGFDQLRFRLIVDPQSRVTGIDLYLGPSEAPGRRGVVAVEALRQRCAPP